MKKIISALFLAAVTMFTGCTTDPAQDKTVLAALPVDSLQYHEIRIDAFSHYWQTHKLMGTSLGGGRLVAVDTSYGPGIFVFDSLILEDLSYDKTASLPSYVVDSVRQRIFYTAQHEPKNFSCYYSNGGKEWAYGDPDATPVLRNSRLTLVDGEEDLLETPFSFGIETANNALETITCGYRAGKGFYIGYRNTDYFYYPDYAVPGGEIIIRY